MRGNLRCPYCGKLMSLFSRTLMEDEEIVKRYSFRCPECKSETPRAISEYEAAILAQKFAPSLTSGEAIDCINNMIDHFDELDFWPHYKQALEIAVEALKREGIA